MLNKVLQYEIIADVNGMGKKINFFLTDKVYRVKIGIISLWL